MAAGSARLAGSLRRAGDGDVSALRQAGDSVVATPDWLSVRRRGPRPFVGTPPARL